MWKYVTCCVKETLQRGVNYFDVRCGAGFASNQNCSVVPRKDNALKNYDEKHRCSGNSDGKDTERNDSNWYQCHIATPWINAFTWSGALVLGWYTSQLLYLSHKRQGWLLEQNKKRCILRTLVRLNTGALHSALHSHYALAQPDPRPPLPILQQVVHSLGADVVDGPRAPPEEDRLEAAVRGLTKVLSSVENQMGLAAIEGGKVDEGLGMLHSAAQRNHAPALYNLGICYEKGLGVKTDERMAAELYAAAANLDHASAMYNLAVFYGQGRGGLARDALTAERLLRQAASRGQPDALHTLRKTTTDKVLLQEKSRPAPVQVAQPFPERRSDERFTNPHSPTEDFLDIIAGNVAPRKYQENHRILLY